MTSLVLTNNAQSTLASGISAAATQITVAAGQGPLFPNPGANEWFPLTLVPADGSPCEIVRATARSGDDIEIVRGQENTTAIALVAGDYVFHHMTAAAHLDLASSGLLTIPTSTGTVNAQTISIPEITALEDNLAFSYVPHLTNTGNTTLVVNSLPVKTMQKYAYDGSDTLEALEADEILLGRQLLLHYDLTNDVYVVSNPNRAGTPSGSVFVEGTLQLAAAGQSTFDQGGDNTRPVTQQSASIIAQEAVDEYATTVADPKLPFNWTDLGNAVLGSQTVLNGNTLALPAGGVRQFDTLTVNAGGTLNITNQGVIIIRCQTEFILNGTLNFPLGGGIAYPLPVIGPLGGVHSAHVANANDVGNYPAKRPRDTFASEATLVGLGPVSTAVFDVEGGILSGIAMHQFQGGNGCTYAERGQSDHGGGVIIIAPSITLGSTAVVTGMHPTAELTFGGGAAETGPGGGGMMVLVSDAVASIDASALFEAAQESTVATTDNHRTAAQLATDPQAIPGPPGAANGQLFTVNRTSGGIAEVF